MTDVTEGFEYHNGVWTARCHTSKGLKLKVRVIGDTGFMKSPSAPIQLQTLMDSLDVHVDKATAFACNSEYRDDISLAGGIGVDSVVVTQWDDIKVWFTLRDSDRMVGVRINKDKAVDVFCDS
ncbi:MAG: hypothetical protein U0996_07145 [Planctomycetaceae bacterium]